jgi:hypothetical protein
MKFDKKIEIDPWDIKTFVYVHVPYANEKVQMSLEAFTEQEIQIMADDLRQTFLNVASTRRTISQRGNNTIKEE